VIITIADLGNGDSIVRDHAQHGPGAPIRASVNLRHYRASAIPSIDDQGVHCPRTYAVENGKALSDLTVGDVVSVTLSIRFDSKQLHDR